MHCSCEPLKIFGLPSHFGSPLQSRDDAGCNMAYLASCFGDNVGSCIFCSLLTAAKHVDSGTFDTGLVAIFVASGVRAFGCQKLRDLLANTGVTTRPWQANAQVSQKHLQTAYVMPTCREASRCTLARRDSMQTPAGPEINTLGTALSLVAKAHRLTGESSLYQRV